MKGGKKISLIQSRSRMFLPNLEDDLLRKEGMALLPCNIELSAMEFALITFIGGKTALREVL